MFGHRSSRLSTRARAIGIVGAAAAAVLVWASPASAELVDPPGTCVGAGTWRDGGFTVESSTADPAAVIEVPRSDEVSWTGALVGREPGAERQIAGSVSLALPVPLGSLTIDDWSGPGTNVASSGVQRYDLPAVVPAGVVFTLRAEHHENGALFCSGSAQLRIAGSPFGSPLTWVSIGLALLFGALLAIAGLGTSPGTGRLIGGALLGLLFGWFAGLSLVLVGVSTLDSVLPLVLAVVGLAGGGAWGRLSLLRRLLRRPVDVGPTVGVGS
jgi:hypothetical protein